MVVTERSGADVTSHDVAVRSNSGADGLQCASGQRLVINDRSASASNQVVEDPLPSLRGSGYVGAAAMGILGDHISCNHGYAPRVCQGSAAGEGDVRAHDRRHPARPVTARIRA